MGSVLLDPTIVRHTVKSPSYEIPRSNAFMGKEYFLRLVDVAVVKIVIQLTWKKYHEIIWIKEGSDDLLICKVLGKIRLQILCWTVNVKIEICVPQEATCFLTHFFPIDKASIVKIELGLAVVVTVVIQRITGSLQKERWTLTQACPIKNATRTRNPMNNLL